MASNGSMFFLCDGPSRVPKSRFRNLPQLCRHSVQGPDSSDTDDGKACKQEEHRIGNLLLERELDLMCLWICQPGAWRTRLIYDCPALPKNLLCTASYHGRTPFVPTTRYRILDKSGVEDATTVTWCPFLLSLATGRLESLRWTDSMRTFTGPPNWKVFSTFVLVPRFPNTIPRNIVNLRITKKRWCDLMTWEDELRKVKMPGRKPLRLKRIHIENGQVHAPRGTKFIQEERHRKSILYGKQAYAKNWSKVRMSDILIIEINNPEMHQMISSCRVTNFGPAISKSNPRKARIDFLIRYLSKLPAAVFSNDLLHTVSGLRCLISS